jgi:hypothetical protein
MNVAEVLESWRPSIVEAYTCRRRNVYTRGQRDICDGRG